MTRKEDMKVSPKPFCTKTATKQTNFALMLTQKMGNVNNEEKSGRSIGGT